jgi:hypothetical protein
MRFLSLTKYKSSNHEAAVGTIRGLVKLSGSLMEKTYRLFTKLKEVFQ